MTEEQIKQKFKETYPDFMRGDEPLSPYFDIWEYGIEIATKELQEENLKLEAKVRTLEIEQNYCLPNCSKIADLENKLSNVSYQLEGREVELKELNKKLSQAEADYDKMFWQKNEIISKAKEIIEGLMRFCRCFAQHHTDDIRYKDAEQFLNEVEE